MSLGATTLVSLAVSRSAFLAALNLHVLHCLGLAWHLPQRFSGVGLVGAIVSMFGGITQPITHWFQSVVCIGQELSVEKDDEMQCTLHLRRAANLRQYTIEMLLD